MAHGGGSSTRAQPYFQDAWASPSPRATHGAAAAAADNVGTPRGSVSRVSLDRAPSPRGNAAAAADSWGRSESRAMPPAPFSTPASGHRAGSLPYSPAATRHLSPPTHTALTFYSPAPGERAPSTPHQHQHQHQIFARRSSREAYEVHGSMHGHSRRLSPVREGPPVFVGAYSRPAAAAAREQYHVHQLDHRQVGGTAAREGATESASSSRPSLVPTPSSSSSSPREQQQQQHEERWQRDGGSSGGGGGGGGGSGESERESERIEDLRAQLERAVNAHTLLMQEYAHKDREVAQLTEEMSEAAAECNELSATLDRERAAHAAAAESNERVVTSLRAQISLMSSERAELLDKMRLQAKETVEQRVNESVAQAAKESDGVVLRQRLALAEQSKDEAVKAALRLTEELEEQKKALVELRAKHSAELQAALRDALASNENSIAAVSSELVRAHESAVRVVEEDRHSLRAQLADAQRELAIAREHHSAALGRETAQTDELRKSVELLSKQREDLVSEAKFQLEIISDHQQEKASMRAEIATLRAVVSSLGGAAAAAHRRYDERRASEEGGTSSGGSNGGGSGVLLPTRISTANVSHALSSSPPPAARPPPGTPDDRAGGGERLHAPTREAALARQLDETEELHRLRQTCAELQEQLDGAVREAGEREHAIVVLKAQLATATAAAATASPPPALEGDEVAADGGGVQEAVVAAGESASHETLDDVATHIAGMNFEISELRKQLNNAREKLRLRDADLEEQQRSYAALEGRLAQERELGDRARADAEDAESRWKGEARELRQRIDTLTKELDAAHKKHSELVEAADAAQLAMADMEQTLADALADALAGCAQQQQQQHQLEKFQQPPGELRTGIAQDAARSPPPPPPPPLPSATSSTAMAGDDDDAAVAQQQQLLEDVASDTTAMRAISALQRRRLSRRDSK